VPGNSEKGNTENSNTEKGDTKKGDDYEKKGREIVKSAPSTPPVTKE